MSMNPFDDDIGSFFVLVNDEEQHSLWSAFADVPAASQSLTGKADRCASGLHRRGPDRYTARKAGRGPGLDA
jgi:hypothetical protein